MDDFSGLSSGVRIFTGSEDFQEWGFGNPTIDEKYRNTKRSPVHIGKFCVIGANSVILPGVTVGEGATVGACSVVTKNLEPWGIYVGNRKIGERNRESILKNCEKFFFRSGRKKYKNITVMLIQNQPFDKPIYVTRPSTTKFRQIY